MQLAEIERRVIVDDAEYVIEVRRSQARHFERFATRCYAIVELPDHWQATVPVPDCVRNTGQLWYRELIELVHLARRIVQQRSTAVA